MAGETWRQGIRAISLQLVGLLAVPQLALTGSPTGFGAVVLALAASRWLAPISLSPNATHHCVCHFHFQV